MTKVTNALATYDVTTNREDLSDAVYRISPSDTPFVSSVPRAKATAVLHEWSLDALASPSTANAQLEGDALSRSPSTPPSRLQNYCQILKQDATVSGTQQAVNPAGIANMMAFQMAKKSLEQRTDLEAICLTNQGYNAGATATARKMRSFNAWISGNGSRGANGADSTAATAAATDGTAGDLRTLDEAMLKDALKDAFADGGAPTMALVGPVNKQVISGFTGRSSSREMVSEDKILGAASVYASDFGNIKIVPNRTQRDRDLFLVDPTKVAVAYLRAYVPSEMGTVGDATTRAIYTEATLEMRAPNAHAAVFDLNA
ncbi:MAG: DUF5309 domain-containing protein [Parvibaculum sp.]